MFHSSRGQSINQSINQSQGLRLLKDQGLEPIFSGHGCQNPTVEAQSSGTTDYGNASDGHAPPLALRPKIKPNLNLDLNLNVSLIFASYNLLLSRLNKTTYKRINKQTNTHTNKYTVINHGWTSSWQKRHHHRCCGVSLSSHILLLLSDMKTNGKPDEMKSSLY